MAWTRARCAGRRSFPPPKSIGNSTTAPRDLLCERDVLRTFTALSESVGARLREAGYCCRTLEIELRSTDLSWTSHRVRLESPSDSNRELLEQAMGLFRQVHRWPGPLRGLGLRCCELCPAGAPRQLSLFSDPVLEAKRRSLDRTLDAIRGKYGKNSIIRGGDPLRVSD